MKKSFLAGMAMLIGASGFASSSQAQSANIDNRQFNPSAGCAKILLTQDRIELRMAGMWAFGYIARANDTTLVVTPKRIKSVIGLLTRACSKNTERKFNTLVEVLSLKLKEKASAKKTPSSGSGSGNVASSIYLDSARIVLRKFFEPNADYVALTAKLRPTDNDIRTVYAEPLASALIKRNNQLFKPGISIKPKANHQTFLVLLSTTRKLKQGHADLDKFPGGYKSVRKYFIKDVPIARFKFIKRGEKLGLAFDGLILVNRRWVLIPKPWRALKQ